jgi:hypothetical protein
MGRGSTPRRRRRPLAAGALALIAVLAIAGFSAARSAEIRPEIPRNVRSGDPGRPAPPVGHAPMIAPAQYQATEPAAAPAPAPAVPFPGDRAAFEQPGAFVEDDPDDLPAWSLTDLWEYDERRSQREAGTNPLVERNWRIGGSTVQSFVVNVSSPRDRFNGPVTWTDRSNDYQLNQQWIYVERMTDTSQQEFDLGGRIDFNYGTNYRWETSAGLEDTWKVNTNRAFYGISMPQAYIETAYNDVKVKWGHFISPVGYFTVDTTKNFFNTIPYTFEYGEAFTHWGALATWKVDDQLVIGGGVTRGWDNFNGAGTGSRGVGGIWTATYTFENRASIAYVGMISNEFTNHMAPVPNYSARYLQSLVLSIPLTDQLSYVAQTNFGTQGNAYDHSDTRRIGRANWYGLNQYLFYTISRRWTWGINFEWFRDEEGYRVGNQLPTASDPSSMVRGLPSNRFGYIGNFYQVTVGPKWTPTKNLFVRPNLRCDWFSGTAANPGGLKPFDDGLRNNQLIVGCDVGLVY